jgi:hypothetical protein
MSNSAEFSSRITRDDDDDRLSDCQSRGLGDNDRLFSSRRSGFIGDDDGTACASSSSHSKIDGSALTTTGFLQCNS